MQTVFINNLKMYRKKARLTQAALALQIDRSFNYINSVECAVLFPPPATIQKIAEVLHIRPMQLFDENTSAENIIASDKEAFITEVSEKIYAKLRTDIHADIAAAVDEALKQG